MDRKISYIDKVIRDSFCAEQRDAFNASFQYVQVTDKTAILIVKVPYQRVLRRIIYRLEHNFTKNFNIELDVYSPLNRRIYLCTNYHIYENQISPHFCRARCDFNGKPHTISAFSHVVSDDIEPMTYLNTLKEHGYDHIESHTCSDEDWNKYASALKEAYDVTLPNLTDMIVTHIVGAGIQ